MSRLGRLVLRHGGPTDYMPAIEAASADINELVHGFERPFIVQPTSHRGIYDYLAWS